MSKKEREEIHRVYEIDLAEMLCVEVGTSHVDDQGRRLQVPVRMVTLQCTATEPSGLFSRGTKIILSNVDTALAADEIQAAETWEGKLVLRKKEEE